MDNSKVALFGAGEFGKSAMEEIGKEGVACFIDNNESIHGRFIFGIPIVSLDKYKKLYYEFPIYITSIHSKDICKQLDDEGIHDYRIFWYQHKQYFPRDILISEKNMATAEDEEDWIKKISESLTISYIESVVEHIGDEVPLFSHVEIETYNRCNGGCKFCPVSTGNDTRTERFMEDELFYKIIDELSAVDYGGRLALFSNNEPFLDDRIVDFHKYAREHVKNARMHIFTNGSKLSVDKLEEVLPCLDELVIDNYTVNNELTPANKKICEYCLQHPGTREKVTIVKRNPNEILTTRGGNAPNRAQMKVYEGVPCLYPYQQLIIRPSGKVSLCCNDPLGKCTMGDVNENSLIEIWQGDEFTKVREALKRGERTFSTL